MSKPTSETAVQSGVPDGGDGSIVPCSLEEVERHLRALIAAFVLPDAQARWLEFLIERRSEWETPLPKTHPGPRAIKMVRKADEVMSQFAVDKRYCAKMPNSQRTAAGFEKMVGNAPGIYFTMGQPPCQMSAANANRKFTWDNGNALLSFQAGRRVLIFRHDDGVWVCDKQPTP